MLANAPYAAIPDSEEKNKFFNYVSKVMLYDTYEHKE